MHQLGVPTYDELSWSPSARAWTRRAPRGCGASCRPPPPATAAAQQDPATAVDALASASHGIDKGLQAASIQATLPAFFPRDPANPWGWQDITAWARYERWMRANQLLTRPPSESPPLTNEFLAGQGAGAAR